MIFFRKCYFQSATPTGVSLYLPILKYFLWQSTQKNTLINLPLPSMARNRRMNKCPVGQKWLITMRNGPIWYSDTLLTRGYLQPCSVQGYSVYFSQNGQLFKNGTACGEKRSEMCNSGFYYNIYVLLLTLWCSRSFSVQLQYFRKKVFSKCYSFYSYIAFSTKLVGIFRLLN